MKKTIFILFISLFFKKSFFGTNINDTSLNIGTNINDTSLNNRSKKITKNTNSTPNINFLNRGKKNLEKLIANLNRENNNLKRSIASLTEQLKSLNELINIEKTQNSFIQTKCKTLINHNKELISHNKKLIGHNKKLMKHNKKI